MAKSEQKKSTDVAEPTPQTLTLRDGTTVVVHTAENGQRVISTGGYLIQGGTDEQRAVQQIANGLLAQVPENLREGVTNVPVLVVQLVLGAQRRQRLGKDATTSPLKLQGERTDKQAEKLAARRERIQRDLARLEEEEAKLQLKS